MSNFNFDQPLEWRVAGTAAMVGQLIRRVAHELSFRGPQYDIEQRTVGGALLP